MAYVFGLRGSIKCYEWGKLGTDSSVAMLYMSTTPNFHVQTNTPYSELWMGTHPSGPSVIPSHNDITLSDWIKEHPESLGYKIRDRFGCVGLPFLFKVLSVRKALSIQVHPNKSTAEILHQKFGDLYPDDNHKPEMAIALTNFQALCGFRPMSEVKAFVLELPQLQSVIGKELATEFLDSEEVSKEFLKKLFHKVITCPEEESQSQLQDLFHHLKTNTSLSDLCKSIRDVFLTIHNEYPGDVGCFCVFFLNFMNLMPSQAIYLAANEPHAYLKGDCIECMACSDNVIRAGLTPKYKDVQTLCDVLSYECKPAHKNIFLSTEDPNDTCVKIYNPPIPEFAVAKIEVEQSPPSYQLTVMDSASILIVVEGDADARFTTDDEEQTTALRFGSVIFISCLTKVELQVTSSKILMYRAYCA